MPPSQLKQLKASIHERRNPNNKKNGTAKAAPVSFKPGQTPYQQTTSQVKQQQAKRRNNPNPGLSDEIRRQTLLPEMQRRHKVGGIVDRRIGENDPTMAPEDRMVQRFYANAKQQQKQRSKRGAAFNLEDDSGSAGEEEDVLTHFGRRISGGDDLSNGARNEMIDAEDDEENGELLVKSRPGKRIHSDEGGDEDAVDEQQRKKSKKEVMDEVIAKSKLYKYERQKAKEEDEGVREDLDQELPELLEALRGGTKSRQESGIATSGPYPTNKQSLTKSSNDYDQNLRQIAADQRAKPTDRMRTEEEIAEAETRRQKEIEEKRLRRMRGEEEEDDDNIGDGVELDENDEDEDDAADEAAGFGLKGQAQPQAPRQLDVEDEDDFIIDKDLVASGSDIDTDFDSDADPSEDEEAANGVADDDDDEFLQEILSEQKGSGLSFKDLESFSNSDFPCPQNHAQLMDLLDGKPHSQLNETIQRVRASHHTQLHQDNKTKLANFAASLVDHLAHIATEQPALATVEILTRHIHSLAKSHTDSVSRTFRMHLQRMYESGGLETGDLLILTAIGTIYPTSDHFHQVVTPAITIIARWLGLTSSPTARDARKGAYLVALALNYQRLSKRYVPEAVRFTHAALRAFASSPDLLPAHLANLTALIHLYSPLSAFAPIFAPTLSTLQPLASTLPAARPVLATLRTHLSQSRRRQRPLELHHHRPLPIKTQVPKFEPQFDPSKHYDPDAARADAAKLRKEHRRERRGAVRELRKDAAFVARERLAEKKQRDRAYEEKQRRLVAEIQGTEAAEKNAYERERRSRKGKR